jgi:Tol biopolymer transport system component
MQMSFWTELTRRKVFKVAAVYAVTAWLLAQVVVTIEAPLNLPDWVDTLVIVLLAIGFPVAIVLSWAFDITPEGVKAASQIPKDLPSSPGPGAAFAYTSQTLMLLAVAYLVLNQFFPGPGDVPKSLTTNVIRYNYGLPEGERLVPTGGVSVAITRDGSKIAYVGESDTGTSQLWIRDRDKLHGVAVPGTEDAVQPFFSPDGSKIGYVTRSQSLKVLTEVGNAPLTLVDGGLYRAGGYWADDAYIYFTMSAGLMRVNASGAEAPELIVPHRTNRPNEFGYGWPQVLPGGQYVLFVVIRNHVPDQIAVADIASGDWQVVTEGVLAHFAASKYLLYVREDGALLAALFEPESGKIDAAGLLGHLLPVGTRPDLALSESGRLVYATRPEQTLEAVWVDRAGDWTPVDPDQRIRGMRYAVLSPDNSKLALGTWDRPPADDGHIWVKHLPAGAYSRLTFGGAVNMRPSWTRDGESVVFISDRSGDRSVWIRRADVTTEAELLFDSDATIDEAFFSTDDEWLVFRQGMEDGERDIFAMQLAEDNLVKLVASEFDEVAPALSPDGRWLAYVAARDGVENVYVRPFPEADKEIQVSVSGGREPVWAPSGGELFYRDLAGRMVAVAVMPGSDFRTGDEDILFDASAYRTDFYHAAYDVAADASRFVMIRLSDRGSLDEDLVVVENFLAEIKTASQPD